MKRKIIYLLMISLLFITACGSANKLREAHDKSSLKEGNIDGYVIDISLKGIYSNKVVNHSYTVGSYTDNAYYILDNNIVDSVYIVDRFTYKQASKSVIGEIGYIKVAEKQDYADIGVYLKTFSNTKIISEEKRNDSCSWCLNEYKVYTYKVKKSEMLKILKRFQIEDIDLRKDILSEVWIDEFDSIYQIVFKIGDGLKEKTDLDLRIAIKESSDLEEPEFPKRK